MENCLENAIQLTIDVVILEPDNAPPLSFHELIAPRVVGPLLFRSVRRAINFNDEPVAHACEVRNKRTDRVLTTETQSAHLRAT